MKIKVDKKEYEQLLARVEQLEKDNDDNWKELFEWLRQEFRNSVENYFTDKCRVVMIKRDRDEIVAELRNQVMDNIFKGQEE